MAVHAGEAAPESGGLYCSRCDAMVHVTEGEPIPECPNGHGEFATQPHETGAPDVNPQHRPPPNG